MGWQCGKFSKSGYATSLIINMECKCGNSPSFRSVGCWMLDFSPPMDELHWGGPDVRHWAASTGAGRLVELWMPLMPLMPWQCGVWPGGIWRFIMIYIYPLVRKHVPIWRFKYPLYVFHVHKDLCEYPLSAESESHWWWLTTTQKSWFDHDRNVFEDWNLGLGARNVLPSPKADNGSWVDDTMKSCCLRQLHQLGKTPDQFVFFNRAGVEI